jgi:aminoglycoside phosphotransferase (APT) family kinase protein
MIIDEQLARRLVERQFPHWADLPITEVGRQGWDNRTYRLGPDLSVRLPSGDWYALQVQKEQRWLPVLAAKLPLPIPVPVAEGLPDLGYPYPWSVYRWLDGEPVADAQIPDRELLADDLARFLVALGRVDAAGGPGPGRHNFYRGSNLSTYAEETHRALGRLGSAVDQAACHAVWEQAVASQWPADPVWFHGDVAVDNLLINDGRLAAVIDFGTSGVGDPACDLVIAWTFFSGSSRDRFMAGIGLDPDTWARGRGWALWKALITIAGHADHEAEPARAAYAVINEVLGDPAAVRGA